MDLDKLKKDRKIAKLIDRDVSYQSSVLSLFYWFGYGLVGWGAQFIVKHPRFMIVTGLMLFIPFIWRVFYVIKFDQGYGSGPSRWRRHFIVVHLIHASSYAIFCFAFLVISGTVTANWFLLTLNIGLACVSLQIWKPYRRVNEAFATILLVPLVFGLVLSGDFYGYNATFMAVGFWLFFIFSSKLQYDQYWRALYNSFMIKEKNKDLETAHARLSKVSEGRVDLFTDLTHEIRTPMNSVLGMLTLLDDSGLNDDQREIVGIAKLAGESMLGLIDDILDFSRISSGNIALISSVFNLRQCIDDTLELLGPVAHAKGIELSSFYEENIPIRVRGDSYRIAQILHNLITNAIKFSDEGEVTVMVQMNRLTDEEGLLRVHVIDQGVGISSERQDELFLAFHKADASTTRKHGGTGLGLAISKGLVEAMHGQIGLMSDVGSGSTFWFTCHLMLSTQQVATMRPVKEFSGQRALIVGAPCGLSESLCAELKSWDIECETSDEGYDKALQLLREGQRQACGYDLVVANLGQRYSDNLKLIKIISQDPILAQVRLVILTTLEQRGVSAIRQILESSKKIISVTKPVNRRQLYEALSQLYGVAPVTTTSVYEGRGEEQFNKHVGREFVILVVEDNKVNQMVASGMLKRLGYVVKMVDNGKKALDAFQNKHFDLILMDCHMPELDGYEAASAIREKESHGDHHIPIVAMTANTADGEETRCLAAGMDDVLLKPISLEELDSKLRRWLTLEDDELGVMHRTAGDDGTQNLPPGSVSC